MTTYNSYQEAKIANNPSAIYKLDNGEFVTGGWIEYRNYGKHTFELCDPADYCMSMLMFYEIGLELIDGDIYQNERGIVCTVGDLGFEEQYCNNLEGHTDPSKVYILKSLALKDIPTETPEEKEVLDGIESAGEVEWSGEGLPPVNIECEWIGGGVAHGDWGPVIVRAYSGDYAWIEKLYDNSMHTVRSPAFFRKPETPQQRKDRERACAIYDMCAEADIFNEESNFWAGKFYDLGYKKDKTHDTN